jgi:hypothetical protein
MKRLIYSIGVVLSALSIVYADWAFVTVPDASKVYVLDINQNYDNVETISTPTSPEDIITLPSRDLVMVIGTD